jgi:ABC-type transport system involved in multi-copper enzyme maturation permease subunit
MLATLLYLFVIFCFGIFISASTHHSGSAMLASLLAWSVLILALPRTVPSLADLIAPVPPRTIVDLRKSVVRRSIDERRIAECDRVLDTLVQKLMAVTGPDTLAAIDNASPEWSARLADIEAKYRPIAARYGRETDSLVSAIDEDFHGRQQQQERLSRSLSLLSPLSSYTYLVTALCATGTLEMANLEQNARDFQRKANEEYYTKFIFRKYGYRLSINAALRILNGTQDREGPKLPLLEYRTMSIGTILANEWMDVGILLLAPLGLLWASYRRFLRYDVR